MHTEKIYRAALIIAIACLVVLTAYTDPFDAPVIKDPVITTRTHGEYWTAQQDGTPDTLLPKPAQRGSVE